MPARVLVVDDVPLNVEMLRAKLAAEYYDVLTAASGGEALEIVREKRPDIILLDVMMPEMDGFEVCRRLKADRATAGIPVVMVTALTESADRVTGLESGADDFLSKPINTVALFARVRSLVRLKRTMDEWKLRDEISARLADVAGEEKDGAGSHAPHILLLEADNRAAKRVRDALAPMAPDLLHVGTGAEIPPHAPAAELVVLGEAEGDVLRLVSHLRADEATRRVPILLVAESDQLDWVAKGLELGADDYVFRPFDRAELLARARGQVKRWRIQEGLRNSYQTGMTLALTDGLTGAYNRRYAEAHLNGLLARRGSDGGAAPALVMLDIDHFKAVNDVHGHPAGDAVLRQLVERLKARVRGSDLVARIGGEEFVVVLPDTGEGGAFDAAERLRLIVAEAPFRLPDGTGLPVTASLGVAVPRQNDTTAAWLKRADEALYAAKHAGRNRAVAADDGAASATIG